MISEENVKNAETEDKVCENAETAEAAKTGEAETVTEEKNDKKKSKKTDAKVAELEKKLSEAEDANAALNDRYMRMAAEYDNFRKRSAKEKDGIYADAYADALKNILPIIDNLERAVGVGDTESVSKGLEMTLKGAGEALTKMGVEAFGAPGDVFDANIHNAMMMVDDENVESGNIVTVFQKGYKKGDKIIRYAMVTVAN